MVTQVAIARRVRLDVSSVNKILNKVPGPVFKKSTIRLVKRMARQMGYKAKPNSKGQLGARLERIRQVVRSSHSTNEEKLLEIRVILDGMRSVLGAALAT